MKVTENRRDIGKEDSPTVLLRNLCRMIGYLERSSMGPTYPLNQFLQALFAANKLPKHSPQLYVTQVVPPPLDLPFSYLNDQQLVVSILETRVDMPDVVLPIWCTKGREVVMHY